MRAVTRQEIDDLIWKAGKNDRKRTMLSLHKEDDMVQRMINAIHPGSYIPPHKHQDPDKVKLFSILKGSIATLHFSSLGEIEAVYIMEARGPLTIIDVPPRTYHTMVALEPSAVLEIIQGPYVAATHRRIADWAPKEDNPKAGDYLLHLQSIIDNWRD